MDFLSLTELAGDSVSQEQIQRCCNRYLWAGQFCKRKDVLEVACGSGQGLGLLKYHAKHIFAGDFSLRILKMAKKHYKERIPLSNFDAQKMPIKDNSIDCILLFEAFYYLSSPVDFVIECKRVLRANGTILIATANKDLFDFNPSPHSFFYFGVREFKKLFDDHGFDTEFFGDTPITEINLWQKILRPIKKISVAFHLIPKSMKAKRLLKKIVFGKLLTMPQEILETTATYKIPIRLQASEPDKKHKVIYCAATRSLAINVKTC